MNTKQKSLLVGIRVFFCGIGEDVSEIDAVESWEKDAHAFTREYQSNCNVWEIHAETDPDVIVECVRVISNDIMDIVLGEDTDDYDEEDEEDEEDDSIRNYERRSYLDDNSSYVRNMEFGGME